MSYDPRTIAIALEDVVQEIGLWSVSASQTLSVAEHVQRHVRESAERTFHHAAVVVSEAQQDGDRVTKLSADASALVDQGETGKVYASATLSEARQVLDAASSTLNFWEEELRKALAWLARAEARLARAIDEYESARRAFEQAQWNLERAQSKYNACQRDKNRSNCNSEARAVNSAQEELQRAAYRLQIAEAEVIAAREEVAAARARVNCCSNAVQYATEAVSVAHEGETLAEQTVNSVERSLEFATAAAQNTAVASDKVAEEIAAAEEMMAAARGAISTTDEAANRLSEADRAEELAQRYARGGGREIEYRLGLLHEINRPDLVISVVGSGSGNAIGVHPKALAGVGALSAHELARQIGGGHSWDKHRAKFPGWDLGKFTSKIEETIQKASGTDTKRLLRSRVAYWNQEEKMVVIYDPTRTDCGTALRPDHGRAYFDSLE
jgi:hypothetical protein